jgi:hypothetical protein
MQGTPPCTKAMSDPQESGRGELRTPYSNQAVRKVTYILDARGGTYAPAEPGDIGLLWTLRRLTGEQTHIHVTGQAAARQAEIAATFVIIQPLKQTGFGKEECTAMATTLNHDTTAASATEAVTESPAQTPGIAPEETESEPAPYEPSDNEIARAAYHRFQARGGEHGGDLDDWLEAERELREKQKDDVP